MVLAFQAASFARLIMAFALAKKPAIGGGLSLGGKRRESRDDRKLRTSRPGRLWLFTHSVAATGGQHRREIVLRSTASDVRLGLP